MHYLRLIAMTPLLLSSLAQAQSTVNIYGLLDIGLTRYSSNKSSSGDLNRVDNGIAQGSRLGFKGAEDLGNGLSTVFVLESGLNVDDGTLGQGGLIFGRQAYAGLKQQGVGTLTLGRQYDFMANIGAAYATGAQSAAGSFAWGLHADAADGAVLNDHTFAGDRTNNAVKFESTSYSGLSFGLMYGFGEVAGDMQANRTLSARVGYDWGAHSLGAAYTTLNDATGKAAKQIVGLGASTRMVPDLRLYGLLTTVKDVANGLRASTGELGGTYATTPQIDLSLGYLYQKRNQDLGHASALVGVADYKFSARTDAYASVVHGQDDAYNAYPVFGGGVQSATSTQNAIRLGLRHRF